VGGGPPTRRDESVPARPSASLTVPPPHASPPKVLACIGEQFTEGDEVCGVAVNVRAKGDRIELWTRTAANEAKQVRVVGQAYWGGWWGRWGGQGMAWRL